MINLKKLLVLISLTVICLPTIASAQFIFEELSTAREKIVFPDLTPEEKLRIAEQAQIYLRDVYVHRFEKLDFYPGLADPVPAIAEVVDNIDDLTPAEMEEAIYRIFVAQRDLHLNYIFPSPYADFRSFLPMTFERTANWWNFFEVRISSVNADQFAQFAPDQRVPEVGDLVVAYDGLPIRQAVNRQLATGQGANRFGGFSRAIDQMTLVPHLLHLVPENDEVTITLVTRKPGSFFGYEYYTITLPWITRTNAPVAAAQRSLQLAPQASIQARSEPAKLKPEDFYQGKDLWQDLVNEFRIQNNLLPRSDYPANPSNEPVLNWGVIDNRYGKFGYLDLNSFVPANGKDFAIEEVRRLIYDEFEDTDGLIFDVRSNGGGNLLLASELPQLFTRGDNTSRQARLLNTDVNRRIFNESILGLFDPQFTQVINDAEGTGAIHSETAAYQTSAEVNRLGQAYYKPVAVLMNARSYSASDSFICAMQDVGGGFVFGEDPRSGAGGANVFDNNLLTFLLPDVFEPLPGTHRMRVSFRQSIRTDINEGKVIEDFGCSADLNVSQVGSDLITGGDAQIRKVTRALSWLSLHPRFHGSVRAPSNDFSIVRTKDDRNYELMVEKTPKVNVFINDELFTEFSLYGYRGKEPVQLEFPVDLPTGQVNSVLVEGVNRRGKRLWNLKRELVLLEEKVVVGDAGFSVDFATKTSVQPFSIINQNAPADGWNLVAPNLQVGFAPNYADNVDTDAVAVLDLTSRTTAQLSFDMEYNTEPGFDFVEVFMTDESGNQRMLLRDSGAQPLQTYNFDVSDFAGMDNVQLHFRFVSDGLITAPGVKLQKVSIN